MASQVKIGYKHVEAFCLMTYRCQSCGFTERIWNSRDGVTPFGVTCPNCKRSTQYHVEWANDTRAVLHADNLKKGDRYFADMTMERAREFAVKVVDREISKGELKTSLRNYRIKQLATYYFGEGNQPDILVKA